MKDYGVYLSGLFFFCTVAAHVVITTKVVDGAYEVQKPTQVRWAWLDTYPEEMIGQFDHTDSESRIFEISELDIPPLINDRCKGDVWRWTCTREEFGHYIERNLWEGMDGRSQPLDWHEMIEIIVDEDGKVQHVFTLLKKEKECPICYDLLEKAVLSMPRWIPGVKNGQTVKTRLVLPFSTFSFS